MDLLLLGIALLPLTRLSGYRWRDGGMVVRGERPGALTEWPTGEHKAWQQFLL